MQKWLYHIALFISCLLATGAGAQEADVPRGVTDSLQIDSLLTLTVSYVQSGDLDRALLSATRAHDIADRLEIRAMKAKALKWMGVIEYGKGNKPLALRHFFASIREFEWSGDTREIIEMNILIGSVYEEEDLDLKALEYFRKAGSLMERENIREGKERLLEMMARAYIGLNEHDSALVVLEQLRVIYLDQGREEMALSVVSQMALSYFSSGNPGQAQQYNFMALGISRKLDDRDAELASLNNIGYVYKYLGEYGKALDYFDQAYDIQRKDERYADELTVTLVNRAIILQNLGQYDEAMEALFKGMKIARERGDQEELARISHLLASIYFLQQDYDKAQVYNNQAMEIAHQGGFPGVRLAACLTASRIHIALYDFEAAMADYQSYLSLRDSIQFEQRLRQQEIDQQKYTVERAEKEIGQLLSDRELQSMEMKQLRLAAEKREQDLELLRKTSELQESIIKNQELEKARAMQDLLLAEERLATEKKDREIQDLKYQQQLQESELRRRELEQVRQQQEIDLLTKDNELKQLNIDRARSRNRFLAGIFLLAMIILGIVIRGFVYARKTNRILTEQRNKIQQQKEAIEDQYVIIERERDKSDRLLLNILPRETAAELKEKGSATPVFYERVSVLFTDFVGFTMVAEKLTPEQLVQELNECFLEFDHIIDRHNLEKIKTIGDAYMCAGGIPVRNETNPVDAVLAALEIRDFMNRKKKERENRGKQYWEIRIGVHTGQVIAGVVGKNKFAYDIWGDAVNTASRMESSGEKNRVNISGDTYELVKDRFLCTYRGKVKAKNKGEIDMYFVDALKKD